jgi:uncharacterized cupin superfamily protein
MPKLDFEAFEQTNRTNYPMPFAADMGGRHVRRLAPALGLKDFGVSHVELDPGGISSQRHWHVNEDEFVVMLEGEAVLIEDQGETILRPGDCAAFAKGVANGHHLVNRSDRRCAFIAFGQAVNGTAHYPDIDLGWDGERQHYIHKDGTPY